MKRRYLHFVTIVLLHLALASQLDASCGCKGVPSSLTTIWGGNELVTVVSKSVYRNIHGMVEAGYGERAEGALVEIFDHPEHLLDELPVPEHQGNQTRIRACRTKADGKFCFTSLPAGKYELRVSLSTGWDVTSEYVIVDPNHGRRDGIDVQLHIGT